jgi:hypothetical protein
MVEFWSTGVLGYEVYSNDNYRSYTTMTALSEFQSFQTFQSFRTKETIYHHEGVPGKEHEVRNRNKNNFRILRDLRDLCGE